MAGDDEERWGRGGGTLEKGEEALGEGEFLTGMGAGGDDDGLLAGVDSDGGEEGAEVFELLW